MKIYQYDNIDKANQALGSFTKNRINVQNSSIVVIDNKPVFFFFTINENKDITVKKINVEVIDKKKLPKKK
jgi:hypothetical protein